MPYYQTEGGSEAVHAHWLTVRRDILPLAQSNGKKMDAVDAYAEVVHAEATMRVQVEGDGEGIAWGADLDAIGARNAKDKDP
ncbi:hypothetical protein JB92DRAFT_2907150 [Gautieria morchelliformis]|nr:hypothetical protein JB92DRAFT_3009130 [Gautieria morchelliformis]KAF8517088.1 hypothetical protein JB92DRAFT_2907150 [Gautieria morchelliformis]